MRRIMKGLLLGLLMLFAIQVTATVRYEDVSPGHWAYGDIVNLTELGILSGIKVDGKLYYKGSDPLNRYQTAVLIGKLLKYIDDNYQKAGMETAVNIPEGITETLNRLEMAIKDDAGNIIQLSEILEIVKGLQSKVATLENKRLEESVPLPQTAVQDILNKIKTISENISYVRSDINTLNASSASFENGLMEANSRLDVVESEILGLNEKLGSVEDAAAGHAASLKTLGETLRIAKETLDSLSSDVDILKSKVSVLETKETGLVSDFESFKSGIVSDLDKLMSKVEALEGSIATFATKSYVNDEVQKASENMKAYVDNKFENVATKDEVDAIKLNLSDLITRSDLSGTLKLYVRIDELTKTKEELTAKDDQLLSEINDAKSTMNARYDDLSKSINILGNKLESLESVKDDVSGLQINYSKVSADLLNVKDALDSLQADYDEFSLSSNKRLDTLEAKAAEAEKTLSDLQSKLTEKLGENFSYFENLMIDVGTLQDKLGAVEIALSDVKAIVENDHATLSKTASDTEALNIEVTDIKSKVSGLEEEILNMPTKDSVQRANDNAVMAIYVGAVGIILGIVGVVLSLNK